MGAEELDFEAAFARLEETVRILEQGDLPLAELVATYEEGVLISARCAQLLDAAELRISQVAQRVDGTVELLPWSTSGHASDQPADSAMTD